MMPRLPWSPEEREQLRQIIAAGKSSLDASRALGRSRKTVIDIAKKYDLGKWTAPGGKPKNWRPVPGDFTATAAGMTTTQLRRHYSASCNTVVRWRKESGIVYEIVPPPRPVRPSPPPGFADLAPTLTMKQARSHFGRGEIMLNHWARDCGVNFRTPRGPIKPNGAKTVNDVTPRDMSRAGQAASFLQRKAPIFRCNQDGTPNKLGSFWRRGLFVLTADDVIERAEQAGWDPHAWKRLPTPTPATNHEGQRA